MMSLSRMIVLTLFFTCYYVSLTASFMIQPVSNRHSLAVDTKARQLTLRAMEGNVENEEDSLIRARVDEAWRFAPKPLLRIGGKGVSQNHGNSLGELLTAHTVVKVKINSQKLGTPQDVFDILKDFVEKGKANISGIELIHVRKSDNTIMCGLEGTMDRIKAGSFPPEEPPEELEEALEE